MGKILFVTYTPRVGSNTQSLVEKAKQRLSSKNTLSAVDLALNPPKLLLRNELSAFIKNNYTDETLTPEENVIVNEYDSYISSLKDCDNLVIAFPMYNFSMPAPVKAWIDAVTQKGKTFTLSEKGFQGLCVGKKALVIITTGYEVGNADFATPLIKTALGFMGIEAEVVTTYGLNQFPDKTSNLLEEASKKISQLSDSWLN
jgi:FMN-dependent NADH-azoreductase